MNLIDVLILAVLVAGALVGFQRGFFLQVATILGAVVALAVAKAEYPAVRSVLSSVVHNHRSATVAAYLIVFLVVWSIIIAVATRLRFLARLLLLGCVDRMAGAVLGLAQAAIVVELLLYLAKRTHSNELHRLVKHSVLAPAFLKAIPYLDRLFPHVPG